MSLRETLIQLLQNLDLSHSSAQAKQEVADAITTLGKHAINIDNSKQTKESVENFINYMFNRFPEVYTRENKSLFQEWKLLSSKNSQPPTP